ncbi:hypothetical protein NKJ06_17770 [Mesorhizobium sp. M0293]|uniref:hypothetical protein n=1 Tax=Mesorhizobium sp. M0293 TaxID=2956930 RepID=UPI0033388832
MLTLDQIETLLGAEARQAVERKRRGGDSADKGSAYEREYALARIVQLAVECLLSADDGTEFRLQAQALCFIDDFLVHHPDRSIFSQLKDKQSQSWAGLADDCRSQRAFNEAARLEGAIEIVVSKADVATRLAESRPDDLADVDVVHFETPFRDYDETIGKILEPFDTSNARRDSRRHILAAWEDLGRNATLAQILQRASEFSSGAIRTLEPEFLLREGIRIILDQLPDFNYRIRSRTFIYDFPDLRGRVPYQCGTERWNDFENRLQLSPPSDFLEFFVLTKDTP